MTVTRLSIAVPAPGFNELREFLMLVKTYPVPSKTYGETVCCAARTFG